MLSEFVLINDYWYKTETLYEEEKDLFDSSKMKNILGALSG